MRDLTEYYEKLNEPHGKEVSDAVRKLNTLYDENIYKWLASLWDGEAGGFYYSISARDNEGFYPDMESTAQAINNLTSNGIISETTPVPRAMQKKLPRRFRSSMPMRTIISIEHGDTLLGKMCDLKMRFGLARTATLRLM